MPQDRYAPAYTQRSVFVEDFSDSYPNDNDNNQDTLASRTPFYASTSSSSTELNPQRSGRLASPNLLYPPSYNQSTASLCSSASNTPVPSRAPSPLYAQDDDVSSCSSEDEETELESSSFLRNLRKRSASLTEVPRWWRDGPRRRRRLSWYRVFRRYILPFIPKTPLTIIFTLLLLTAFAISLANLIIYLCNPDKQPLPWRGYCTLPDYSTEPPPSFLGAYASFPIQPPEHIVPRSFPPDNLDTLAPIGVFVGVFSMDSGFERRALIRDTYASHPRSRNGAGEGDGGVGTSRTVVRFVMGRPRKDLERKVQLEMETYNDIIILPIKENMNDGKTYNFFKWAATGAWVPPLYFDNLQPIPKSLSYSNLTSPAPILAHHDPVHAHRDQLTGNPKPWVRPDFIIKADDDSFVMLAELEAHLRVEMHTESPPKRYKHQPELVAPPANHSVPTIPVAPNDDPMIFWGYPVKNRFMAGELYALTHTLVDWISKDKDVAANVRGAEDQITSRWVRWHPRSQDVRWVRERCWVYDHPKAGTVYSRGFLFPSEAKRVQSQILGDLARWKKALRAPPSSPPPPGALDDYVDPFGPQGGTPPNWVLSSVATFQVRYSPPVQGFSLNHSLEALVEGSELSKMKQRNVTLWDEAYNRREGRITQYQGKRVGGTTVVHSIKKHMWFLETASALLEGDDYTELELAQKPSSGHSSQHKLKPLGRRHRSHLLPTPPHLT